MLYEEKKNVNYPYSRRQFMKGVGALGMLTAIPWLSACQVDSKIKDGVLGQHSQMAFDLMDILFPQDDNGPSSVQINAYQYLDWVLQDENYDADIKKSIIKGFARFAAFSKEEYGQFFEKLSQKEKMHLVAKVAQYTWGENLLARLVSMILDSLVLDPIYGVNVAGIGWDWLGHTPGIPRATSENRYPKILERKTELKIISNISEVS